MFGLPMSTTLIMGGIMLFWVVYTIVFYVRTKNWTLEDADYEGPGGGPGPEGPRPDGPGPDDRGPLDASAPEGGTR